MRKLRIHFPFLLALAFLTCTALPGQNSIFVSITGAQQGKIEGAGTQKGKEGLSQVTSFEHQIVAPRDAASGMATGRRQHSPLIIRKEIDKATPKLYAALTNNENLTEVTLSFYRQGGKMGPASFGAASKWYEIRLSNAVISGIKSGVDEKGVPFEEVSINYQQIRWEYTDGSITHEDVWAPTRN